MNNELGIDNSMIIFCFFVCFEEFNILGVCLAR